ncbi:SPFH domain-containing protein [Pannus brasiliensis CCIBt3594]|uniref:SPFH domain-containing protein n=1 Tax=Pannus brasiliensis CCIBt3594 TaxID=1427578 RepID=A0AAW9QRP3_9CHRO
MNFWLVFLTSLPSVSPRAVAREKQPADLLLVSDRPIPTLPAQPTFAQVGGAGDLLIFPGLLGAIIILLIVGVFVYTRVYVIAPTNEAFVRTGGIILKNKEVILNGGCVVLPGFHKLTRVPLREISIDVVRSGNQAVRTQDYLRANMRVTFYVCVTAIKEDVLNAASRLSKDGIVSEANIKDALEKRADDAIRAAAKQKSIAEIDSDKLGFAQEVFNLIQPDLKKVGLTLNNIAISEIEESDTYDENNFFDAQGVKLRTETIQRSIKQKLDVELTTHRQKKELELATKVAVEQQELSAEKQSLEIAKQKEDARLSQEKDLEALRLDRQREIELLKVQREREIQESQAQEIAKMERAKILQQKAVEEEKIQQDLAIQQSQIEAKIALEERNKQLKVTQILQQQESEIAEITRQKTIESSNLEARAEVALAEQASKIAQQEAAIAIANKEKERFTTEAERARAEATIVTAQELEKAEREKNLSLIAAEQEAQKRRVADQNVVEIDVFRRRRQAEIARQAAQLEAESIKTLADANRYKAIAEAEAQQALIAAINSRNTVTVTADLIKTIWPELVTRLPEIVQALAPQPGVLGDARIYAFPTLGDRPGQNLGEINKLLLSTSGLSLINTFLDEGKLGDLIGQIQQLLRPEANGEREVSPTVAGAIETVSNDGKASDSIDPPTFVEIDEAAPSA